MKIVHITSNISGGAGIATLRLHRSLLQRKEIESHILQKNDTDATLLCENIATLYESKNVFYRLKRKLGLTPEMQQNKLISTYARNYEYEIATFPTTSYRIENHPLVKDADIIHLHWVANFLNYPTFFRKVKKPTVWTLHDKNPFHGLFHTETDERNNSLEFGALDIKIKNDKIKFIKPAKNLYIVTPSQWLLKKSINSATFNKFPHLCIANSIELSSTKIDTNYAKEKIGVLNNNKTLLFIAHSIDIPRRGFFIMKEALNLLDDALKGINLITVGGNKLDLNIPDVNHIHFTSTSDQKLLNTIYSAADIQILPTQEDNLPNVMLESFANGTPVISFANGGMAEHIITGENGILVDEIGAESLKIAIEDFLNDRYIFNRDSIRQYAKEHFDQEQQAQKYIDLYKKILNQ